jgi:hypothetical protein
VFGAFVGGVGFEFGAIRGAMLFHFFGFILGEFRLGGGLIFRGVEMSFFLTFFFFRFFVLGKFRFARGVDFFGFVFLEFGATSEGIDFGVIGSFFVFCFSQFEGE